MIVVVAVVLFDLFIDVDIYNDDGRNDGDAVISLTKLLIHFFRISRFPLSSSYPLDIIATTNTTTTTTTNFIINS